MEIKIKDFEIQVAAILGADESVISPEIIALPIYATTAFMELVKKYPWIGEALKENEPLGPTEPEESDESEDEINGEALEPPVEPDVLSETVGADEEATAEETPQDRLYAERAVIAATALRLFPYWKLNYNKVESLPGSRIEVFEPDWESLQSSLEAELDSALTKGDVEEDMTSLFGFRLTFGDGGRCQK